MINSQTTHTEHLTVADQTAWYSVGFTYDTNTTTGVPELTVILDGSNLTYGTDYIVGVSGVQLTTQPEADLVLVIRRNVPFTQEIDFQIGIIDPEQIEHGFDRSVMRDQELVDYANWLEGEVGDIKDQLDTFGDVVTHDASDFATAAQGSKADTAVQPSDLSTVATTGSYNDLINKPTLGTAAAANITDFATAAQGAKADTAIQPTDLATVATTGSYNDLSNKPTIPTVGSGLVTITQDGETKGSFNVNQSTNTTIDIGGGDYTAGTGIDITNDVISVDDPVLINKTQVGNSLVIGESATTTAPLGGTVVVGSNAQSAADRTTVLGWNARAAGEGGIAIGTAARSAQGGITISSRTGTASLDGAAENEFTVLTDNGKFTILQSDGTIPEARLASTTSATAGKVLTLDSNLNAVWDTPTGGVTSVNGQSGDVVLSAKNVNAIPQYSVLPTADSTNVGDIVQYVGATIPDTDATATATQTVGSSLSNLSVDVAVFESAAQPSGDETFDFVCSEESGSAFETPTYLNDQVAYTIDTPAVVAFLAQATDHTDYDYIRIRRYGDDNYRVRFFFNSDITEGSPFIDYADQTTNDIIAMGITPVDITDTSGTNVISNYITTTVAVWSLDDVTVNLLDYGITFTGTPVADDVIEVQYVAGTQGLTNGYFYKSTLDGNYRWIRIDVQPGGSGGSGGLDIAWTSRNVMSKSDLQAYRDLYGDSTNIPFKIEIPNAPKGHYSFYVECACAANGAPHMLGYRRAKVEFDYDPSLTVQENAWNCTVNIIFDGETCVPSNSVYLQQTSFPMTVFMATDDSGTLWLYGSRSGENAIGTDINTIIDYLPSADYTVTRMSDIMKDGNVFSGAIITYGWFDSDPGDWASVWQKPLVPPMSIYPLGARIVVSAVEIQDRTNPILHLDLSYLGGSELFVSFAPYNDDAITLKITDMLLDWGKYNVEVTDIKGSTLNNISVYGSSGSIYIPLDPTVFGDGFYFSAYCSALYNPTHQLSYNIEDFVPNESTRLLVYSGATCILGQVKRENLGSVVQYIGETNQVIASRATVAQTVGSGLSNISVDVNTFETAAQPSGDGTFDFVCGVETVTGFETPTYLNGQIAYTINTPAVVAFLAQTTDHTDYNRIRIRRLGADNYRVRFFFNSEVTEGLSYIDYANQTENNIIAMGITPVNITDTSGADVISNYTTTTQTSWTLNGNAVNLADYGISFSGTPVQDDTIEVQYTAGVTLPYIKGYFYKADGTLVIVPPTETFSDPQSTGLTVTDPDNYLFDWLVAQGWEGIGTYYLTGFDDWDNPGQFGGFAVDYVDGGETIYVGELYASDMLDHNMTVSGYVSESWPMIQVDITGGGIILQNPHWEQYNVQPPAKVVAAITLAVADWSNNEQTVTVTGVTADSIVFVNPAPASSSDYATCGVMCSAQAADSLTFTCTTTPVGPITVNVISL